jgi:antitoxin PrlF
MGKLRGTSKGQVTLKPDFLKHLGVGPGGIKADNLPDDRIVVRAVSRDGGITDFIGCLSQPGGRKFTIERMNHIAAGGWAKAK